jgi:hypothetical protein
MVVPRRSGWIGIIPDTLSSNKDSSLTAPWQPDTKGG